MNQKIISLAYCIDNIHLAEDIDQKLENSFYRFKHIYGKKDTASPSLSEQLKNTVGPILLIITDNFLKSAQCMNDSLDLLQSKSADILPVVAPGQTRDPENNELVEAPTHFERVSDIIQYINYWQDQYLDLRRQKRSVQSDAEEQHLNDRLKIMREISSEAGEFLRLLRNMNYVTHETLFEDHFKVLFEFTDDLDQWYTFKRIAPQNTPVAPAEETIIAQEEVEELEEDTDMGAIPGMDLLEGKDNIARILEQKKLQKESEEQPEEEITQPSDLTSREVREEESSTEEDNSVHPTPAQTENEVMDDDDDEGTETPSEESLKVHKEELITANVESDEEEEEGDDDEDDQPNNILHESFDDDDDLDDFDDDDDDEEELENPVVAEAAVRGILTQAMYLIDQGQFKDSVALLEKGINDYPDNPDLRYRYALLLAQDGSDIQGAVSQLSIILTRQPNNDDANFLMGELAEMNGQFADARRYYERVATSNPEYPDVYYRLGYVLSNHFEQEYMQAAKYFKMAARKNPSNVDALYRYAVLLNEKLDKPHKAIKYFKRALAEQPDHPFANYDLALLYHRIGNKPAAHKAYSRAITINPELKTPENDLVFAFKETAPSASLPLNTSFIKEEEEQDTIAALRDNIKRLEEILNARAEKPRKVSLPEVDIKTVFISGATSGIGKATAELFASHGHRVILNGRREERLQDMKRALEELHHSDVFICPFDVRDIQSVEQSISALPEEWHDIDILINNAGKAKGLAPIHQGQLQHWEEMIDTNLKGILYLTRIISPNMVRRKTGHIINISSSAGKEVYPKGNVYCATKHGVEALTKAMRIDLHEHNIRVSQVSPGHVEETEFALVRFDGDSEKAKIYEDFKPLTARDVAQSIYFIASQPAHVNVQDIVLFGTQQATATMVNRTGRE